MKQQKMITVGEGEDQVVYTIGMLQPSKALTILTKLTKLFGPSLMAVAGQGENMDAMSKALQLLSENLDEEQVLSLVKELVNAAFIDNKSIMFETHFAGRLDHIFEVVGAVLEHNYGNVLGKIGALAKSRGLN